MVIYTLCFAARSAPLVYGSIVRIWSTICTAFTRFLIQHHPDYLIWSFISRSDFWIRSSAFGLDWFSKLILSLELQSVSNIDLLASIIHSSYIWIWSFIFGLDFLIRSSFFFFLGPTMIGSPVWQVFTRSTKLHLDHILKSDIYFWMGSWNLFISWSVCIFICTPCDLILHFWSSVLGIKSLYSIICLWLDLQS